MRPVNDLPSPKPLIPNAEYSKPDDNCSLKVFRFSFFIPHDCGIAGGSAYNWDAVKTMPGFNSFQVPKITPPFEVSNANAGGSWIWSIDKISRALANEDEPLDQFNCSGTLNSKIPSLASP